MNKPKQTQEFHMASRFNRILLLFAAGTCIGLTTSCTSIYSPKQVESFVRQGIARTENFSANEHWVEARMMVDALNMVDPDNVAVAKLDIDLQGKVNVEPSLMSTNRAMRTTIHRPWKNKILFYIPDRIFDLLDIVSANVSLGPGLYVDAHITRGVQAALGARTNLGVGIHDYGSIGFQNRTDVTANLFVVGTQSSTVSQFGTSGLSYKKSALHGLHLPQEELYQEVHDYWAIGGSAQAILIGAEVEFHPIQLLDFATGIFGYDLANDDWAHTRGLQLKQSDRDLIRRLVRISGDKKLIAAYLAPPEQEEEQGMSDKPADETDTKDQSASPTESETAPPPADSPKSDEAPTEAPPAPEQPPAQPVE